MYLNLWTSEFCFQNTPSELLHSLSVFFITAIFPAGIESTELTQARVKSDTKWLSSLFLCNFFKIFSCFIFDFETLLLVFFFLRVLVMSLNTFPFKYVHTQALPCFISKHHPQIYAAILFVHIILFVKNFSPEYDSFWVLMRYVLRKMCHCFQRGIGRQQLHYNSLTVEQ